jgi:adenosylcobinamide hydrolase
MEGPVSTTDNRSLGATYRFMDHRNTFLLEHTPTHVHVAFVPPRPTLSSAVLGGGLQFAAHIVNLRVEENCHGEHGPCEPPEATLSCYCREMGWEGNSVGMMTAASMKSFRLTRIKEQGVEVVALVTAGLSNARCAGDPAECRMFCPAPPPCGTINALILTNARLTPSAMVEAVITATEAKSAVLQKLGVVSRATGQQATGTGTDCLAVASGFGPVEARYSGKHVLFGEMVAQTLIQALSDSLTWHENNP